MPTHKAFMGPSARMLQSLSSSLSGVGIFYIVYLAWAALRRWRHNRQWHRLPEPEDGDDAVWHTSSKSSSLANVRTGNGHTNASNSPSFGWSAVRPVFTQLLTSALRDRLTLNALGGLSVAVLGDDKVKAQLREIVVDVCRSKEVQASAASCVAAVLPSPCVGQAVVRLFVSACTGNDGDHIAKVLATAPPPLPSKLSADACADAAQDAKWHRPAYWACENGA